METASGHFKAHTDVNMQFMSSDDTLDFNVL
jgi:hypothetical protein